MPSDSRPYKAGDTILHKPSGEKWVVAAVNPHRDEIVCCGWPESIAPFSDIELVESCSDAESADMLRRCVEGRNDTRASWARETLRLMKEPARG